MTRLKRAPSGARFFIAARQSPSGHENRTGSAWSPFPCGSPALGSQPSTTSKSCVISAVLPSMMLAEQYFSAESFTACSTRFGSSDLPVTVKWTWIFVNTLGSVSARVASRSATQSLTCWRLLRRMWTTSNAEQPPIPRSSSSIGRTPRFLPPESGEPSMTTVWPDSLWPAKLTPSMSLTRAFMGFLSGKNRAEFVPQNTQPFVQREGAVAQAGGGGQQVEHVIDAGAGKLDAGGDDFEPLRLEQRHGPPQVPGMGEQHDAADAVFLQQRGGEAGVVPGGERGVFDPAGRQAVFVLQDALHDASLGEQAAAGLAAGDQQRQAAFAMQSRSVAQAFQADALEGVAAVFGVVEAASAAEDDDGVRRLASGRVERGADFQAFEQHAAGPRGGQGIERGGRQADQRQAEATAAALHEQSGGQQNHQRKRRQQDE